MKKSDIIKLLNHVLSGEIEAIPHEEIKRKLAHILREEDYFHEFTRLMKA